jgi:TonB family protein
MIRPAAGEKLYTVHEFYLSGKIKLIGKATEIDENLTMQGPCIQFYPNGKRQSIITYSSEGKKGGDMIFYYPNGKLYCIEIYDRDKNLPPTIYLKECRDSTGNVIAENGNGHWLEFDNDGKKLIEEGEVKNGFKNGEWQGSESDSIKYISIYNNGKLNGKTYSFKYTGELPIKDNLSLFLAGKIIYPAPDREHNIQGTVTLYFFVDKDGNLGNIKVVSAPSKTLGEEAVRVLKLSSPWSPGIYYGVPRPAYFTIPMKFKLNSD